MRVFFRSSALDDARQIQDWWIENRPAAPTLFLDELKSALDLLAAQPQAGRIARSDQDLANVRRLLMHRSRYHLYYRVDGEDLEVLSIWHSSRGGDPEIE